MSFRVIDAGTVPWPAPADVAKVVMLAAGEQAA